jgi:hypothetical protein
MEHDIWTIVSGALGVVALVAGAFWGKLKKRLNLALDLLREVKELVDEAVELSGSAVKMLEDDKVTKEEIASLKQGLADLKGEADDVIFAAKALFKKLDDE